MIWQSRPVLESGDDHKKFQRKLGAKNGVMLARALGLAYNTEHPVTKVRHGEENFVFRATSIVNWQRRQGTRELGGRVDFTPALGCSFMSSASSDYSLSHFFRLRGGCT